MSPAALLSQAATALLPLGGTVPAAAATKTHTAAATAAAAAGATPGVVSVTPREIVMCAPGVGIRPFDCFDAVLGGAAGYGASQAAVYVAAPAVCRHGIHTARAHALYPDRILGH